MLVQLMIQIFVEEKALLTTLLDASFSDEICQAGKEQTPNCEKRSYKDFKVEDFLTEVLESQINDAVTDCEELDEAAEMFEGMFKTILDKHAPVKVFQMRKNYTPYLREETKLLMEEQKVLKEEMTRTGDITLAKELKVLSKEIERVSRKMKKSNLKMD